MQTVDEEGDERITGGWNVGGVAGDRDQEEDQSGLGGSGISSSSACQILTPFLCVIHLHGAM